MASPSQTEGVFRLAVFEKPGSDPDNPDPTEVELWVVRGQEMIPGGTKRPLRIDPLEAKPDLHDNERRIEEGDSSRQVMDRLGDTDNLLFVVKATRCHGQKWWALTVFRI